MNKKLLSLLLLSILLLTGCSAEGLEVTDNIKAPSNLEPPLMGKWVIKDYEMTDKSTINEKEAKDYIKKEVVFHKDLVVIGKNYSINPSYKVKNVNTADYLLYNYKIRPKTLGLDKDYIQVISITGKEQFFYEFIKQDDLNVIVNIDGVFFKIKKVSEEVNDELIAEYHFDDKEAGVFGITGNENNAIDRTGLIVGLKSPDTESKVEHWDYRTIFLRFTNRRIEASYENKGIMLPRKNGFWNVETIRENRDGKLNDLIVTEPIKKKHLSTTRKSNSRNLDNGLKNILYIGSNYISLENISTDEKNLKYLEFYPLDNVNRGKPMKISDIIGDKGKEAFIDGMNKDQYVRDNKEKLNISEKSIDEHNFGLFRRNGHWTLKGRINLDSKSKKTHKDFSINTLMPQDIVSYDDLSIPWMAIKQSIPETVDAFISPNNDIIMVQTYGNLFVYSIKDGDIGDIPLAKIALKPGETVIMKEWAVGKYPVAWEEELLKNKFKILEYK